MVFFFNETLELVSNHKFPSIGPLGVENFLKSPRNVRRRRLNVSRLHEKFAATICLHFPNLPDRMSA